jgi:hypothetical protein
MGEVTTIGLDLAKHVFQVHGVDAEGATVLRTIGAAAVEKHDDAVVALERRGAAYKR